MSSIKPGHPLGGEDRIAVARLETVAAFRRKATISPLRESRTRGMSCRWFAHRAMGVKLTVVEGTIALAPDASDMSGIAATRHLLSLSGAHIARVSIISGMDVSLASQAGRGLMQHSALSECRELLRLGDDPEDFLDRLGKHTRRNIRRAERIASELGMRTAFRGELPPQAPDAVVLDLAAKNKPVPLDDGRVAAYEAMIAGKQMGFESRITLPTGQLVSYLRGYIENGAAHLIYQANDPLVPRINLSLLHRFLLIERLIAIGISEIIFPFGCEGMLKSACEALWVEERVVIRPSVRGICTGLAVALGQPNTRLGMTVRAILANELPQMLRLPSLRKLFQLASARWVAGSTGAFHQPPPSAVKSATVS